MRIRLSFWPALRFGLRTVGWGIRFIVPLLVLAFHFIVGMCLNCVTGWWVGVPNACRRTAEEWVNRAAQRQIPSIYFRWIYGLVWLETFLVILAGWLILSHVTVWLLRMIIVQWPF